MPLLALWIALGAAAGGQQQAPPEPPEEDQSLAEKEYAFNPIQARKELNTGNFYFKRSNYKAAAGRFLEATRWDPGYAEAYLRLGEAHEKLKDAAAARAAYEKYLELAPKGKGAEQIRKKLAGGT